MNKILEILKSKRFTAFYWHSGAMALAGFIDLFTQEITSLNPDNHITIIAGLILAQISKYLNTIKND